MNITPLQEKKCFVWEYINAAQLMRMCAGIHDNLTSLQLSTLYHHLFHPDGKFKHPTSIITLCNNSTKDAILAMMKACNVHGLYPTWKPPARKVALDWFDKLMEVAIRGEGKIIHKTT
ncbi:hypothetical protein D1007_59481 [Hordeum vulgare]|nr:hypothetical protein D1007_59481 [Hordeum vulgare]